MVMAKNATETRRPQDRWISVEAASERVPYTYKHLLKVIKAGKLPAGVAHRPVPGGKWLIDADAFDRWVENGCFTETPGHGAGGAAAS